MNEDVNQRFAIRAEVVFTTQQDMDEFGAQHFFEQELSEWEGLRSDLDFESVRTKQVVELPADNDEYNMLNAAGLGADCHGIQGSQQPWRV